jgi:hypothetical protein
VVGRLNRGITKDDVTAELSAIAGDLEQRFPATNKGWGIALAPLQHCLEAKGIGR